MKTRNIKWLALLLCMVMLIGALSACSSGTPAATDPPATKAPATGDTPSGDDKTDAPADPDPVVTDAPLEGSLICEPGTETLTVWLPRMESTCQLFSDFDENPTAAEAEKLTGVNIDWTLVTQDSASSLYSLMIASDDLTDIVAHHNTATLTFGMGRGADSVVEDGYFLRLNELIDGYAPNFKTLINSDKEAYLKEITTDSGNICAFYWLETEAYAWVGLGYRIDVMEKIGMEDKVPTTIAGWEEVFDILKANGMYEYPFNLSQYGYFSGPNLFASAFDVSFSFYQVDGEVKYGPVQDGYKDYLRMMKSWGDKGYYNPSDITDNNGFPALVNDLSMCYQAANAGLGTSWGETGMAIVPTFNLGAAYSPKVNESDTIKLGFVATHIGPATAVSTNCEKPELAVKWLDFWYSEEGSFLANYGVEGKTFTYDAEGNPQYTEFVTHNDEGLSLDQTLQTYCFANIVGLCYTDAKFIAEPAKLAGQIIWTNSSTGEYDMPSGITHTAEEGTRYAAIFADMETYVKECTAKFLSGTMDIDADWDSYLAEFEKMGLSEITAIQQNAYNRYISR